MSTSGACTLVHRNSIVVCMPCHILWHRYWSFATRWSNNCPFSSGISFTLCQYLTNVMLWVSCKPHSCLKAVPSTSCLNILALKSSLFLLLYSLMSYPNILLLLHVLSLMGVLVQKPYYGPELCPQWLFSICNIFRLSTCQMIVQCILFMILFATHGS